MGKFVTFGRDPMWTSYLLSRRRQARHGHLAVSQVVGDLECELGQGQAGIFGAGSDPEHALMVRRQVGIQPEASCSHGGLGTRQARCPESNVMALARAVIDCFLETDVLAASEQIKGAEWRGRIG